MYVHALGHLLVLVVALEAHFTVLKLAKAACTTHWASEWIVSTSVARLTHPRTASLSPLSTRAAAPTDCNCRPLGPTYTDGSSSFRVVVRHFATCIPPASAPPSSRGAITRCCARGRADRHGQCSSPALPLLPSLSSLGRRDLGRRTRRNSINPFTRSPED